MGERRLLALVRGHRMKRLLKRMLDPDGVPVATTASAPSAATTWSIRIAWTWTAPSYEVRYEPGESTTGLFGGNSNWRGPIWFPINFLLIEALQKFHHYYGDDFLVECPTGSGQKLTLWQVAADISRRLRTHLPARTPTAGGRSSARSSCSRPIRTGATTSRSTSTSTATPARLGASHQTGWTGLVAKLLEQTAMHANAPAPSAASRRIAAASV